ncbi:hypothetical protein [Adhaeribacter terreus]|uniref:DUF4149 domain-containing protein n=1 Tax=Adhaeribacter terreus TaxID=529703 RepID=A0ABW0EGA8_9BACT
MSTTVSPFPMNNFFFKSAGAIITLAGFLLFCWLKFTGQVLPVEAFNYDSQVQGSLWIFALGLFLMAFSKEKIDDERVQQIRAVAMRLGFQLLATMLIIINMSGIKKGIFEVPFTLELLIGCLLAYLLFFHASLYFNLNLSSADNSVSENMRIQPKFYLIFVVVQIIGLALLFFFR